jgi:hypothetical protein
MRRGRRGNSFVETALFLPFLLLLLVGMVQFGKITYVYYTLKKTLYAAATYISTQPWVDFCDEADAGIQSAIAFALTGGPEGSGEPQISDLTADMIRVEAECVDGYSGAVGPCTIAGCGTPAGGPRPDFIVVSIPDGYPVLPRIPYLASDPIPLRPYVRVPFGGA